MIGNHDPLSGPFRPRVRKSVMPTVSVAAENVEDRGSKGGKDYENSSQKDRALVKRLMKFFVRLGTPPRQFQMFFSQYSARHRRLIWSVTVFVVAIILAIRFSRFCSKKYYRAFGKHPMEGGAYGRLIDEAVVRYVTRDTVYKKRLELQKIGLELPEVDDIKEVLTINTNAGLGELVRRREARVETLREKLRTADEYQSRCLSNSTNDDRRGPWSAYFYSPSQEPPAAAKGIPHVFLIPQVSSWLPPRPSTIQPHDVATFSEKEMRELVEQRCPSILQAFDSLNIVKDQIQMWSICAIYNLGGIFLGNRAQISLASWDELLQTAWAGLNASTLDSFSQSHCESPFGLVVFGASSPSASHQDGIPTVKIALLAATPRHPHLGCILDRMELQRGIDASRLLEMFFLSEKSWQSSLAYNSLRGAPVISNRWEKLSTPHWSLDQRVCETLDTKRVDSFPGIPETAPDFKQHNHIFVQIKRIPQRLQSTEAKIVQTFVEIRESIGRDALVPARSKKVTLESIITERGVSPGWLCSRCLKAPILGTLEKCVSVCPSGYEDLICNGTASLPRRVIPVTLDISSNAEEAEENTNRIPRIIHQTFFEELSADRYPQLKRLQNSWVNSGWDYRFYTDNDARKYIMSNFPDRFVRAFDAIIPGAYKADLFRYLVLLKDGGVYADVDVLLDSALDAFITPNLSFFAPRDIVGEYADEPFCLWNGLIGSAPGHPFLVKTVERLINLISRRADLYDMEQDVCTRQGRSMEIWKVRAEPLLLLSGPCALGMAVNDVLERPSLERFDFGWLPQVDPIVDYGDALVLVGDKFDLGAFRISDPERSLMLASTDLPGVTKEPREAAGYFPKNKEARKVRRKVAHYSSTALGGPIWGGHNVYEDDMVDPEEIRFAVSFNSKNL